MLFDYSYNDGDTVLLVGLDNTSLHNEREFICKIASKHITGQERRCYSFYSLDQQENTTPFITWTEGIGYDQDPFILELRDITGGFVTNELTCFTDNLGDTYPLKNKECIIEERIYPAVQRPEAPEGQVRVSADGALQWTGAELTGLALYNMSATRVWAWQSSTDSASGQTNQTGALNKKTPSGTQSDSAPEQAKSSGALNKKTPNGTQSDSAETPQDGLRQDENSGVQAGNSWRLPKLPAGRYIYLATDRYGRRYTGKLLLTR